MTDIQPHQSDTTPAVMEPVNTKTLNQLKSYAEAWGSAAQIAEQLARTDFAGPFKGKPQDMAVAILKGASLGIPPESIGKSIYVVHGTPSLYGKTALAIALKHGYIAETIEDTSKAVTVRMTAPHGQQMEVRYTIQRATQEGLVKGNKVQYETRPSKMLFWKCIGELTDRMIPHLVGGMPIKEDWEQSPVKATATRVDDQRGLDQVRAALAARKPAPEPKQGAEVDEQAAEIDVTQTPTQAYLLERIKVAGPDDLTGIAEISQANLDPAEYEPVREALNTRYYDLNQQED